MRPVVTMADVEWAFVWLMVALKVPLLALLWIVWWSIRAQPDGAEDQAGGGGGGRHPRPSLPRLPRRGPHAGEPPPRAPERVRSSRGRPVPARR